MKTELKKNKIKLQHCSFDFAVVDLVSLEFSQLQIADVME